TGVHRRILTMWHRYEQAFVSPLLRLSSQAYTIFMLSFSTVCPAIGYIHLAAKIFQLIDNINNPSIAQIWTVLLEGQTHNQHTRISNGMSCFDHRLDQLGRYIRPHPIIDPAPSENDFRMVSNRLRLMSEVVRINPNAVPAHQTRLERQEVPFGTRSRQHL